SPSHLFSFASVLYTFGAGRSPFRADTTLATLRRVCEDTPRPLCAINPDVPEWLEALIARLHSKDPGERFATAAEVAGLLSQCLTQLQTGAGVTSLRLRTTGDRPGAARRRWPRSLLFAAAAAALLLPVAFALTWYFTRPDAETTSGHGPQTATRPGVTPSLLLTGQNRVELANTAGIIDLNGDFTVEMWVKFARGDVQYFAGDETWPGVAKVDRPSGWVLRIAEDERMNFTAGATITDRPGVEWAQERGDVIVFDDDWHHLAVSSSREGIHVFLDGRPYLHMKTANIRFMNSPFNM